MGELKAETWIEAARTYQRLYRRAWRFSLAHVGIFLTFVILFAAASGRGVNPVVAPLLFFLFLPAACACILGGLITTFELREFPCPRCSQRFNKKTWIWSWPTARCHHCGLDLGAAAKVPEKKDTVNDPWE